MSDESDLRNFPAPTVTGEILPFLQPKQRAALIDWVFKEIGGAEKMAQWADRNDETRKEFYKIWSRMSSRPGFEQQDPDKNKETIEKLLARLDAGQTAVVANGVKVIDATPVPADGGERE